MIGCIRSLNRSSNKSESWFISRSTTTEFPKLWNEISRSTLLSGVLLSFFLNACAVSVPGVYHNTEIEQDISAKDLPPKVLAALPKEINRKEFTYKRKLKNGVISYDVDYKKDRHRFSIAYDDQGKLEEEKEVKFTDIPYNPKDKS